jgi:hypothetical protein
MVFRLQKHTGKTHIYLPLWALSTQPPQSITTAPQTTASTAMSPSAVYLTLLEELAVMQNTSYVLLSF